jgi:hypothetical protein
MTIDDHAKCSAVANAEVRWDARESVFEVVRNLGADGNEETSVRS